MDPVKNLEIERKFLVSAPPEGYQNHPKKEIVQGYLTEGQGETEVRLRGKGNTFYLTVKRGQGIVRLESEIEINKLQFEALWPLTEGQRLEKTRYEISINSHVIEMDVYKGELDSLITAEVEFDSEKACNAFTPPPWMSEEISDDTRYQNRMLAVNGIPGQK